MPMPSSNHASTRQNACILVIAVLGLLDGHHLSANTDHGPNPQATPHPTSHAEPLSPLTHQLDLAVTGPSLGQFWGAVLVARDGEVLLSRGYGLANQDGRRIDSTSLFELASVTKPFTAVLVLRLDQAGKLAIDDPIAKHLPGVPADKQAITIRHLLNHTSGLGAPMAPPPSDTREAAEAFYLAAPQSTQPGTAYAYSNIGYMLLAAIVERVTGTPFEEALRAQVLEPAGMTSSGVCGEARLQRHRAVARAGSGGPMAPEAIIDEGAIQWPYPARWAYVGCGGVVSSLDDLRAFDLALRDDTLLDANRRDALFAPGIGGTALGWQVSSGPTGLVAEHTGAVAGFHTIVRRWLDRDQLIVVLTNNRNDPTAIATRLAEVLSPELVERAEATIRLAGLEAKSQWMRTLPPEAEIAVARAERPAPSPPPGPGPRPKQQPVADASTLPICLVVTAPGASDPAIAIDLSIAAALSLADGLETALSVINAGPSADPGVEAVPPVRASVYPARYSDQGEVIRIAGRPLRVEAIPMTMHVQPGDEHRVSITLHDPNRQFMPVFIELGRSPARRTAQSLRAACGG